MTLFLMQCLSEKQESIISTTLDGIPIDEEEIYISQALFAVYTVISSLGILFAIGILIFNLVFAKKRFLNRYLYFPLFMLVILCHTPSSPSQSCETFQSLSQCDDHCWSHLVLH